MNRIKNGLYVAFDLVALPIVSAIAILTVDDDIITPYIDDLRDRIHKINEEIKSIVDEEEHN